MYKGEPAEGCDLTRKEDHKQKSTGERQWCKGMEIKEKKKDPQPPTRGKSNGE